MQGPVGPQGPQGPIGATPSLAGYLYYRQANTIEGENGGSLAVTGSTGLIKDGPQHKMEVRSAGSGDAASMAFHCPSNYAVLIGLDPDGHFKIGGWSIGAASYKFLHEANSFTIDLGNGRLNTGYNVISSKSVSGGYSWIGGYTGALGFNNVPRNREHALVRKVFGHEGEGMVEGYNQCRRILGLDP